MTHPGLPIEWALPALFIMLGLLLYGGLAAAPAASRPRHLDLNTVPLVGGLVTQFTASPWPLVLLRAAMVAIFLLIVAAGLFGTPIPERNLATTLTWTVWWSALIISIFFLGSAWCAVCPWDALASWLTRRRLWRRGSENASLNLRVPRRLRNVWIALLMFVGLSWLELGAGVTTNPYATALLALLMVVLATLSLAVFERKAFCRNFCPVGRTVGFYARLAPFELRPVTQKTCDDCTTLDCYHGNESIEPCPTHLVMGRLRENTYCLSCGACVLSCPHDNVSWRLRPMATEAIHDARPRHDEAWFMLGLLALTSFHGITMMPFWESWISQLARLIHDSGQLLWSFSIAMLVMLIIPVVFYALTIALTSRTLAQAIPYRRLFNALSFTALPLAFSYHIAHNLGHLVREGDGLLAVFGNPLGSGTLPLSMMEKHNRHLSLLLPEPLLFGLQAAIMVFGVWLAVRILQYRGSQLLAPGCQRPGWQLLPMLIFIAVITGVNMSLLMQPMVMRL